MALEEIPPSGHSKKPVWAIGCCIYIYTYTEYIYTTVASMEKQQRSDRREAVRGTSISRHHGSRGALNWAAIMPKDARLSDSGHIFFA